MNRKLKALALLLFVCSFLLLSCTTTTSILLEDDRQAGDAHINLETTDYFKALLVDLTSFNEQQDTSRDPDTIILDNSIATLMANLRNCPAVEKANFYRTENKVYYGDVSFNDLELAVAEIGNDKAMTFFKINRQRNTTELTINLSMENYQVLSDLVPFLTEPNFEAYGPVYNHGSTEEDYLLMMDFILGEGCSDEIQKSVIVIDFELPGKITKTNGIQTAPDKVEFSIPLLKLLLLNDPINFNVTWNN